VQGSIRKRCPCPPRRDATGKKIPCTRPHGSWTFVVDVPARPGVARRQVTRGGFATKKDAETALAEFLTRVAHGHQPAPGRLTVAEYLEEWLVGCELSLAATAFTNYRTVLRTYVVPRLGQVPLLKVTPAALTRLYADLVASGSRRGGPLSPATVRTVHRIVSKALGDAVREQLLPSNPATHAKLPRRQRPELQTWNAEQAAAFLAHARTDRLYLAWLLALACGLRRGELAGLRWSDIDLERATLEVVHQRTVDSEWNVVSKEPKGTSRRTIDLGPGVVAAVREHRSRAASERLAAGPVWQDCGLVFVDQLGRPYHPDRFTRMFRHVSAKAAVPLIRLHDARHSCATLALAAGIHPKVVQQLLGHASWSTTMDLYTHRVERLQREASAIIEALVLPTPAEAG
jgi:integrase